MEIQLTTKQLGILLSIQNEGLAIEAQAQKALQELRKKEFEILSLILEPYNITDFSNLQLADGKLIVTTAVKEDNKLKKSKK